MTKYRKLYFTKLVKNRSAKLTQLEFQPVLLPDILQNHPLVASRILEKGPTLGHFRDYLDPGFLPSETGYRLVRKPSKIYMEKTNLPRAVAGKLGGKDQAGTIRETFFAHQMKNAGMNVHIPSRGDFLVEGQYLFEIGGSTKGKSQVKDAHNAFAARDDIEVGFGNVIPL